MVVGVARVDPAVVVAAIIQAVVAVGINLPLPGSKDLPVRNHLLLRLRRHQGAKAAENLPISWRWRVAAMAVLPLLLLPHKACLLRQLTALASGTEEATAVDHHLPEQVDLLHRGPGERHLLLHGPIIP